jgi:PKD repeat protein
MPAKTWFRNWLANRASGNARRRPVAGRRRLNVEHLEDRTVPAVTAYHFDMGPPGAQVAVGYPGYLAISAGTDDTAARGYGWVGGVDLQNWQRPTGIPLTRTYVQAPDESFAVDLRNGAYTVLLTVGNSNSPRGPMTIFLDGQQAGTVTTAVNQSKTVQYTADVTNGQLTVRVAGQNNASIPIDGLNIFAASSSLLSTGILPVRQSSAPTATFSTSGPVNEGGTGTVSFANVTGGTGPYTYSYGFNSNGTFDVTGSTQSTISIPAQYVAESAGLVIRGLVTDSTGASTEYTTVVSVNNVAPAVTPAAAVVPAVKGVPTNVNLGSFTDPGIDDGPWTVTVNWGDKTKSTLTTTTMGGLSAAHVYATAGSYRAVVTVGDINGAAGSGAVLVTAALPLSATFSNGGAVNEASAATVAFSHVTGGTGPYTYSYDFNNDGKFEITGSTQSTATVPAQYLNPTSQTVHARVTDSAGVSSDYTTTITVNDLPPAVMSGAAGQTAVRGVSSTFGLGSFGDPGTNDGPWTVAIHWGDNTTSTYTTSSPVALTGAHTYAVVGAFTASVTVTDKYGASGSASTTLTATASSIAATFASGGPVKEGGTDTVTFSNVTGGTGPYTYSYDFDNDGVFEITGSSQATATVPAQYLADGPYNRVVHGRITDIAGATSDYTTTIAVNNVPPTVAFSGPFFGTPASAVTFAATVTDPSPADTAAGFTYLWNFGDGATSTLAAPTHTYSAAGSYTVTVTATDKDGSVGSASTSATVSSAAPVNDFLDNGQAGFSTTGSWSTAGGGYGGNHLDRAPNSGAGTATWQLNGLAPGRYDIQTTWAVYSGRTPDAEYQVYDGATLLATVSINQNNFPLGGAFGGVPFQSLGSFTITSGTAQVILVGNDDGDTIADAVRVASVTAGGSNAGPSATFSNSGSVSAGGSATVSFANATGGTGPYTYSYDFNNDGTFEISGSTQATANIPAPYLANGPALQTFHGRVTDSTGAYTDYTTSITVNNVPPTVSLVGPFSETTGAPVNFVATVTDTSPANIAAGFTYVWAFGDGATSTQPAPTHAYSAAGTYTVTVGVTDQHGATTYATASVVVGNYIVTPYETIPDFGANPTVSAVHSGNWSNPATWSTGQVPGAGDVVAIGANTTVTYDVVSTAAVNTVEVHSGGVLQFRPDINTELMVVNLLVLAGGTLQVGTTANPVQSNVSAQIVFADQPLNLTTDPSQYGNGLIALGTVTMCGATKSETFVNLAAEAHAGNTTLLLSQPVSGWRAGDRLILPDTSQPSDTSLASNWELVTLAAVSADGKALTLTAPLQYDHLGARDANGVLTFLPDVGDLTRNVVVKSANAQGTRGYTLFTGRAAVDIRYTQFSGLGRTTNNIQDNTTYDAAGNVTHVGTNQIGRYSVFFDNLVGPTTAPADGYQFTFEGNAVFCPIQPMNFRWGIDIANSSYGLVQDNVLYNWAGAGIITQTGAEIDNVINHNFVVHIVGTGTRADSGGGDAGREGSSFWFAEPENIVTNNVAADNATPGYDFGYTFFDVGAVAVPAFQGADDSVAGQFMMQNMEQTPLLNFTGNTVYGNHFGLTLWFLGASYTSTDSTIGLSLVENFHAWHVENGFFAYPINNVTFDGYVVRGDASHENNGQWSQGIYGVDYMTHNFVLQNSDIQGMFVGVNVPTKVGDVSDTGQTPALYTIKNTYLSNAINIYAETLNAETGGGSLEAPRKVVIQNVTFGSGETNIYLDFLTPATSSSPNISWMQSDQFFVYGYNGVAGDNFEVYWTEQAADAIVPQTSGQGVGAPVADLTNQESWDIYGSAVAGSVAPATATTQAGIQGGLVEPI